MVSLDAAKSSALMCRMHRMKTRLRRRAFAMSCGVLETRYQLRQNYPSELHCLLFLEDPLPTSAVFPAMKCNRFQHQIVDFLPITDDAGR